MTLAYGGGKRVRYQKEFGLMLSRTVEAAQTPEFAKAFCFFSGN
jgi:hypothetical protein